MKVRLGYIASPLTIEDINYAKTMTYANFKKKPRDESFAKLDYITKNNLENLKKVLIYNLKNDITFYRMTHDLTPLATHNDVQYDAFKFRREWEEIGEIINKNNIRIDTHPDQFCVLNSENLSAIKNTIEVLKHHSIMFKVMKIKSKAIIHVGGGINDKQKALERFKNVYNSLSNDIKEIIIVENDDRIFDSEDVLSLCEELKIPMVFDYHHYIINGKNNIRELLPRIVSTWAGTGLKPKFHFSSSKNKKEMRSHHDYADPQEFIGFLNILKEFEIDCDIMLECKAKDLALFKLLRQLDFYCNIKMLNKTTFIF